MQEAHHLLAPGLRLSTEGFDKLNLKQARTVLDELASGIPGSAQMAHRLSHVDEPEARRSVPPPPPDWSRTAMAAVCVEVVGPSDLKSPLDSTITP
jgi:hypothetical protein